MDYRIFPPEDILETEVVLPASKSIEARALVMHYIAGGNVGTAGSCDDTTTLARILDAGLPTDGSTINVGPAGTAMRFLTALCAATPGCRCTIKGTDRMHQRPIAPLVDTLRRLGADISYSGTDGFPPLTIAGRKLAGGTADIDASTSSQFISALMMIAPLLDSPLTLNLQGYVQSMPYIEMTGEMMRRRGAVVEIDRDRIYIDASHGLATLLESEPDWSAAAFWYEIAALTAGWVTLKRLSNNSLQGDRHAAALFERLGVLTEYTDEGAELSATPDLYNSLDADLTDMPDAVPALVVTCCLIGIPFRLSGIGALHDKECDRIEALQTEMAKIGCILDTEAYGTVLTWDGRRQPIADLPEFDSHGDHRMAMALASAAVYMPGIVLRHADVAAKSYPAFWHQLIAAGFTLETA